MTIARVVGGIGIGVIGICGFAILGVAVGRTLALGTFTGAWLTAAAAPTTTTALLGRTVLVDVTVDVPIGFAIGRIVTVLVVVYRTVVRRIRIGRIAVRTFLR